MEYLELLNALKADLNTIHARGQSTVQIEALQKYIENGLSSKQTDSNLEHKKLELQRSLAHQDVQSRHDIEMFKSVIDAGREALNALILINGGAVVALLGFLGAAITKEFSPTLGLQLTPSILFFGTGVLVGSVSFGLRYVTQYCYAYDWLKTGHGLNISSNLAAITGYIMFACGIYTAYNAFVHQFSTIKTI